MIVETFKKWFKEPSFDSLLEDYILSHNPKNHCDIERLTEEFERRCFLQEKVKL